MASNTSNSAVDHLIKYQVFGANAILSRGCGSVSAAVTAASFILDDEEGSARRSAAR